MKKAPVLSEEQVIEWIKANYGENAIIAPMAHGKPAQRDADHEYYVSKIKEIFEELYKICPHWGDIPKRACPVCMDELEDKYLEKTNENNS